MSKSREPMPLDLNLKVADKNYFYRLCSRYNKSPNNLLREIVESYLKSEFAKETKTT